MNHKRVKIIRSDKVLSDAIDRRFSQLNPVDQIAITECAITLKSEVQNMGQKTAVEILYQVGRLIAIHEKQSGQTSV